MTNENTQTTPTHGTTAKTAATHSDENRWVTRLEEILQVKNVDDLKTELSKLAGEIQTEIQNFDLNAHLSPEAKSRLKSLEKNYNEVVRAVHKTQKQFDREFNKTLRVMKRTRQDAEKQLKLIKNKLTQHQTTLVKASKSLKTKIKKTTAKVSRKPKKATKSAAKGKTAKAKA